MRHKWIQLQWEFNCAWLNVRPFAEQGSLTDNAWPRGKKVPKRCARVTHSNRVHSPTKPHRRNEGIKKVSARHNNRADAPELFSNSQYDEAKQRISSWSVWRNPRSRTSVNPCTYGITLARRTFHKTVYVADNTDWPWSQLDQLHHAS